MTRDGRVKILDFGLATARGAIPGSLDAAATVTETAPGTILGTVAYMSPEQARGEADLSAQSDQFALGLVLYELAAGRRAFLRGSPAETMAAIIREEPEPLPATTPARLRWVIERLLAKDPADRYDSTRDLYRELRQIRDRLSEATSASVAAAATTPARARLRVRSVAALAAAVLAGAVLGGAAIAMWFASKLWIVPYPAGAPTRLAALDTVYLQAASWMPDSRRLVLTRLPPEAPTLSMLDTVTGDLRVFYKSPGVMMSTVVSRDGTRLAYVAGRVQWNVVEVGAPDGRVGRGRRPGALPCIPHGHHPARATCSPPTVAEDGASRRRQPPNATPAGCSRSRMPPSCFPGGRQTGASSCLCGQGGRTSS